MSTRSRHDLLAIRQVTKNQILVLLFLLLLELQSEASQLQFLFHPKDSVVIQHKPASFDCQAENDGQSPVIIRWFFDSQEIQNSSDHLLFDNGTLYYPSITSPGAVPPGTSMLRCKASDESGTIISREAKVQFAYLTDYPSTARSSQEEIGTNNTVYLQCPTSSPDSIPKAEVIWKKDNVEFTGGLNLGRYATSLQIPSATSSLDGSYTCEFWNSLLRKSVTSPAVLLTVRPSSKKLHIVTFTTGTQVVSVGGSVLFECVAWAPSPPTVTWSKLDEQLPSGRVSYIGSNLKIVNVETRDAGQYECMAEQQGDISRTYFKLEVDETPVIQQFSPSFNDTRVIQHSFTALCTAYSKPKPQLYWSFNGVPLNQSELVRLGVTNSTTMLSEQLTVTVELTISRVSKNNQGYYQCFASNLAGDVNRHFFLQVNVPPTLVVSPQSKQVHENETFILSCEIAGSPAPSLTWKLDGQTITSDNHRTVTVTTEKDRVTSNLHVDRSGHEDTGMYTCDGKNDAASTSSTSVRVLVYVGAEITKIQDVKAHINTTVILNIEIIGLPSPSVNWYFGQPSRHISSTDNHYKYLDNGTLKITQLNFIDVGQYDVEVQNEIDGQVYRQRKQLTLSVLPTISISKKENKPSSIGIKASLSCMTEGNPLPSTIHWYKDGTRIMTSEDRKISVTYDGKLYRLTSWLLINETREEDFGNYSCKAISDAGESPLASTRLIMGDSPTHGPVVKLGGGDGGEGLSVAAIGVIVGVVVFVGIAVGVAIAVRLWRRRQTMILEKSVASQVQLERVMRQSDQTSPGFYASSGPHPALELEMNDEADCSVHTSGDKDVSFSSFRRRQEAPSLTQSPPPQLGGQERETVQGRVMGRRSTGYGRRSTGGDSTDLPPYSIRDPLRSPTVPGGPLRERGEPSATAISTDVDSFYSDQKRISYRSTGSTSGQVTAEGQEPTDISTVV